MAFHFFHIKKHYLPVTEEGVLPVWQHRRQCVVPEDDLLPGLHQQQVALLVQPEAVAGEEQEAKDRQHLARGSVGLLAILVCICIEQGGNYVYYLVRSLSTSTCFYRVLHCWRLSIKRMQKWSS